MRRSTLAGMLLTSLVVVACGDDDSSGPDGGGPADDLIGTWEATSIQTPVSDLIALGLTFEVTLSDDSYTYVVTGDGLGAFCEEELSCTVTGDYTATATTVTLDPGTVDALTLNWTLSGSTLTLTGTIDETPVTFVFQKQ